jgi:preprotein translocase subunit SecD
MSGVDARTGPQNTSLSGGSAGFGPLPADLAAIPDLASTTPIASPSTQAHLLVFTAWAPDPKVGNGPEPGYRPALIGLTGHDIQSATATIGDNGAGWVINVTFTPRGADLLRTLTRNNVTACVNASTVCAQRHLAVWVELTQTDINNWEDPAYVVRASQPFDLGCLAQASSTTVCPKLVSDSITLAEIDGGNMTVSGNFTQQSANDLAKAINAEHS